MKEIIYFDGVEDSIQSLILTRPPFALRSWSQFKCWFWWVNPFTRKKMTFTYWAQIPQDEEWHHVLVVREPDE